MAFFKVIKNYAEVTSIIDKKIISQEASYTSKQNSRRVESPETCIKENYLLDSEEKLFLLYKTRTLSLERNFEQFAQIFGDSTLLELCLDA